MSLTRQAGRLRYTRTLYFPSPMASILTSYLAQRLEGSPFLLAVDLERTIADLFGDDDPPLPRPYKIFFTDEAQAPVFGFPLAISPAMLDLETKLDRWLGDEVHWQVRKEWKERAQVSLQAYLSQLIKLAENALVSNLLADYHGVFWLAHSFDLAKHFSSIPRRVGTLDAQLGKTQGDVFKYRIFAKWATETREAMARIASRATAVLDGEEERSLQFFRLLQDNVLILTEEFVGPDLRELRSFVTGYLHRDFQQFRDRFDRLRTVTQELLRGDRVLRGAVALFGSNPDQALPTGLLTDRHFQKFIFGHPSIEPILTREEREQFQLVSRRLNEFAVLHLLRRGITWMSLTPEGEVVPADRKLGITYSKTTRPIDFSMPGVVDPMVHRFGLMYDITSFSETLGSLARAGRKEELNSYRQMLLFQRKVEAIAERHGLQFEKFLGDGAFYTTRRAIRLLRAAVEIQRFYREMRKRGFAFDKGLRLALNYGYYRLLPMKGSGGSSERVMEFYGPGVVELSRLTTGKASKEIEEIQGFLLAHGYDTAKVHQFFAPLARGVDMIDHRMHEREFYAYLNTSSHLVNEGIVASLSLIQELSLEIFSEAHQLYTLRSGWGQYVGFAPSIEGLEYIGMRLIGTVSLKGLAQIEVAEIVPFAQGETEATALGDGEPLVTVLRQEYHYRDLQADLPVAAETSERELTAELIVCAPEGGDPRDVEVVIGEWNPASDEIRNSVRVPRGDLEQLLGVPGPLSLDSLERKRDSLVEFYRAIKDKEPFSSVNLAELRSSTETATFLVGVRVERL